MLVGSSDLATVPPEAVGVAPSASWLLSADSKSVRPARKPGVLTLAMLSAMTRERSERPVSAACSVDVVTSVIIVRTADEAGQTLSASRYGGLTRDRSGC